LSSTRYPGADAHEAAAAERRRRLEGLIDLSTYFGTSHAYWINLQAHFDLEMAKDKVGKQAARINPHPHDETGALRPI
jgi:antitoxin HigA-1